LLTRLASAIGLLAILAAAGSVVRPDQALVRWLVPAVGVGGVLFGFLWMIRTPSTSEDHPPFWRSRRS
jgi:hypothetical protein